MKERKKQRLPDFDYGRPGWYFVTSCVKNSFYPLSVLSNAVSGESINIVGNGRDRSLQLTETGKIIDDRINWLQNQYECAEIDEYIIMPDHVHIIIVRNCDIVRNGRDRSLQNKIKPLPELMGAFKTTSSKLIRQNIDPSFSWQKSYHDRIIRNDDELNRIRMYIRNNPANYKYKEC
ncbi:MAG TPA: hypothetical protein DCS13_12055 [Candidatus Margulisbacteria bacterium]|nr:MAG: hypothetical protein A2X43_02505 [Candidatus Margulisbacteria bacterium GWD2_39_127]HAR64190.1 hypothetical protein [Candidatus Margulisiibacteriota bacterium]